MLLKDIRSSKDLKGCSIAELQDLASQLREKIISHVAVHGGHLASSLGVIELTLAMHFVYNTPEDIIVWDVGHQAYVHKLLTGRYDRFDTLRKKGGLSGFLKRSESPYDAFGAGHASTSISAALGFAVARDHLGKKNSVVAVIGDGAMTGGMAFEALNNAGLAKQNMTIILNDNKMSIAPNVGGFSRYLNRVISDPKYNKLRHDIDKVMRRIPGLLGARFRELLGVGEDAIKSVLKPGRLFEDLGIRYFGPIDGHNLPELIEMLDRVRAIPGPCLLHVVSEKGRGLKLAENDPYKWHASVPFDPESGDALSPGSSRPTLTSVFGKAMLELAKADRRLIGITGAMPGGCGLNIVEKELPGRVIDVGIAEEHAITFAAGMACEGVIPVCAIYSSFLQRAYDQMVHDVALQHLHVVFVLDRAGLVGADGPTHHGNLDLTYMRSIPGMVVMAPSDENELRDMLYTAVQYQDGPIALRYPRGNAYAEKVREGFNALEIGKFRVVEEGREVLLLGVGFMLAELRIAAQILRAHGFAPTLVDARFIKPLDTEGYRTLFQNHNIVVTLEDNSIVGGFGSAIAELLADLGLSGHQLFRFGLPDSFVEHGEIAELYQSLGIDGKSLAQTLMDRLATGHRENT
jgi:1-deoxy-D-xylulose-5-phosphate synthase